MKARWLGAGFTVIATIIAAMILARLIEAIVTGSSVNVRNYGLLLSGVVGAILVGWRNAVAGRQADLQDEALFNDKINAAAEDLAARRQVTRPTFTTKDEENDKKQESILTEWEDDMVTRAAAIDRLEGLARERPLEVPRIAALLSVYARELSKQKGLTPKDHWIPKDGASIPALREWARRLKPIRSDMEKAVQTLGRLREIEGQDDLSIDLREANLQGFDLQGLNFDTARMSSARMEGANLNGAQMQGAYLSEAKMQGVDLRRAQMQRANLSWAQMQGANLDDTQIQGADLSWAQMQGSYLREAKMHGADLFIAQIDQSTLVSESTFSGAGVALSDWSSANLSPSHVAVMFGDASVKLPFDNPEWWPDIAFDFDSLISDSPWDIEFAHWRAAPDTYDWNTRRGHYTDDGWINPDNPPPEWKP
ncbi:MAG: hypothetical protein ACJA0F_002098 [Dinoroseobacter sp.]|jgi:uncharacterized protein YjbI with pentapeptide repeats